MQVGQTLVGLGGFEPPTSRLSGGRSNQLSYRPAPRGRGSKLALGFGLQKLNSVRRHSENRPDRSPIERVTGRTRDSNSLTADRIEFPRMGRRKVDFDLVMIEDFEIDSDKSKADLPSVSLERR